MDEHTDLFADRWTFRIGKNQFEIYKDTVTALGFLAVGALGWYAMNQVLLLPPIPDEEVRAGSANFLKGLFQLFTVGGTAITAGLWYVHRQKNL